MSDDKPAPHVPHGMSIWTDNALKFVIAGLVGVLAWISKEQISRLDRIETDVAGMKIQIAEMRSDLKHIDNRP